MNFTQHALDKLDLYGILPEEIREAYRIVVQDFYDTKENSKVRIIHVRQILLALIIDLETENLITVYRTDQKTVESRRKAKRWV